jgi:ornithine carbamoyltransferase
MTQTTTQTLGVASEVGALKQAILHRPGLELSRLTPDNVDSLLFDDILWAKRAREEHDAFAQALSDQGVRVHYFNELLTQTLDQPGARDWVLGQIATPDTVGPALIEPLRKLWEETDSETLATHLIGGVLKDELPLRSPHSLVWNTLGADDFTAKVLGRMYDAIEYRGFDQTIVEGLAQYSGVPVYNGLTDQYHPTQTLCDVLTMREHSSKPIEEISYAYLGDARNNVANSLLSIGAILGMDVRLAAPQALWPDAALIAACRELAAHSGARITLTEDVTEAVHGADYLYTDVWVSMGEPTETWKERIEQLLPYQVNAKTMTATGNPHTKFLHCLPALHDRTTGLGEQLYQEHGLDALEVTDEVFTSPASLVFDQAENRMHAIKAILVATLGD